MKRASLLKSAVIPLGLIVAVTSSFFIFFFSNSQENEQTQVSKIEAACEKITGEKTKPVEVHLFGQDTQYWCVEKSGKMHRVFLNGYFDLDCQENDSKCIERKETANAACVKAGYSKARDANQTMLFCDNGADAPGMVWNVLFEPSPWEDGTPLSNPNP